MSLVITCAQKLLEARYKADLCQYHVAQKSGLSQPLICRYESGRVAQKIDKLEALAKVYGVSVSWLVRRDS